MCASQDVHGSMHTPALDLGQHAHVSDALVIVHEHLHVSALGRHGECGGCGVDASSTGDVFCQLEQRKHENEQCSVRRCTRSCCLIAWMDSMQSVRVNHASDGILLLCILWRRRV